MAQCPPDNHEDIGMGAKHKAEKSPQKATATSVAENTNDTKQSQDFH